MAQPYAVHRAFARIAKRIVDGIFKRQTVGIAVYQHLRHETAAKCALLVRRIESLAPERLPADIVQLEDTGDIGNLCGNPPGLVEIAADAKPILRIRHSIAIESVDCGKSASRQHRRHNGSRIFHCLHIPSTPRTRTLSVRHPRPTDGSTRHGTHRPQPAKQNGCRASGGNCRERS